MRISDFKDISFKNGGLFTSEGDWCHSKRVIDTHEIMIVTRGVVYIRQNGGEHTLRPGDFLLLKKGLEHGGFRVSECVTEFFWLHFDGILPFESEFYGTLTNPAIVLQSAGQLLQICEKAEYPKGVAECMLLVLLSELWVQSLAEKNVSLLAVRAHEYIRSHSYKPLTAKSVAKVMNCNADHLSRVMKKEYSKTLSQDIAHERMNRAKLLLQTTSLNVSELAFELGYSDPNLFEKFFRYHEHCTPIEYRKITAYRHTNHK